MAAEALEQATGHRGDDVFQDSLTLGGAVASLRVNNSSDSPGPQPGRVNSPSE